MFQVDTRELNINRLCKTGQSLDTLDRLDRVLLGWKKTNSLMWSHWAHFVWNRGLWNYNVPLHRCHGQDFFHNLPMEEDESVCRSIYANEMVKLTIQIADPSVMVITKDVSATFPDMLGIVGIVIFLYWAKNNTCTWLQECCRQVEAGVLSYSRKKLHKPFTYKYYFRAQ